MAKILYIDLSLGFEKLGMIQNQYGGAVLPFVWYRESTNDLYIAGVEESFQDLSDDEKSEKNILLSKEEVENIKNGALLSNYIKNLNEFDIIIHGHFSIRLNTSDVKGKQVCWVFGHYEKINEQNDILIMHNEKAQNAIITNRNTKIFNIQLGRQIPEFKYYKKLDYLFQCTNQSSALHSAELAKVCRENKIKIIFAGPISEGCPLLNEIDNINTFYIGMVPHFIKNEYLKYAIGHVLIYSIKINNLSYSGIDALSYGCPIITNGAGYLEHVIKNDYNGYVISTWDEFILAHKQLNKIDQKNCYETASSFSIDKTKETLDFAFDKIINL